VSERDPSLPTGEPVEGGPTRRIEIAGDLDRQAVEALQLEMRRLARLHSVGIANLRIERAPADEENSSA
jgi:hypothetical protein